MSEQQPARAAACPRRNPCAHAGVEFPARFTPLTLCLFDAQQDGCGLHADVLAHMGQLPQLQRQVTFHMQPEGPQAGRHVGEMGVKRWEGENARWKTGLG